MGEAHDVITWGRNNYNFNSLLDRMGWNLGVFIIVNWYGSDNISTAVYKSQLPIYIYIYAFHCTFCHSIVSRYDPHTTVVLMCNENSIILICIIIFKFLMLFQLKISWKDKIVNVVVCWMHYVIFICAVAFSCQLNVYGFCLIICQSQTYNQVWPNQAPDGFGNSNSVQPEGYYACLLLLYFRIKKKLETKDSYRKYLCLLTCLTGTFGQVHEQKTAVCGIIPNIFRILIRKSAF